MFFEGELLFFLALLSCAVHYQNIQNLPASF